MSLRVQARKRKKGWINNLRKVGNFITPYLAKNLRELKIWSLS